MSTDLFFKNSKRNWSREPLASKPEYAVQVTAQRQATQQNRLTALKAKADGGDKKAQKKWARISKRVAKLHLKASKGDLKAAKKLAALTPTGLFVTTVSPKVLKTVMHGSFVGKDEILGTFIGADSVTRVRGSDKLTEIISSGEFIGNDKLTEIISGGQFIGHGNRNQTTPNKTKRPSDLESCLGKDEILGNGQFIGEEELALAAEGGACERAALKRRNRRTA
jgi:hypothetical protein